MQSLPERIVFFYNSEQQKFVSGIASCLKAYIDFYPYETRSPQLTTTYYGALGVDESTLQLASQLNELKDIFKHTIKAFLFFYNQRETTLIHQTLKKAQCPAIKLKQVYRHIPIFNFQPRLVTFNQIKHNSKVRISAQKAKEKLLKSGAGAHIEVQLQKLNHNIDSLVIHRETAPLNLITVSSFKNQDDRVTTQRLFSSLPILYKRQPNLPIPEVRFSTSRKIRKVRSDKYIEENPFLQSIHAYRFYYK